MTRLTRLVLIFGTLFTKTVLTAVLPRSGSVLHEVLLASSGWTRYGPASPDHILELRIGLTNNNFEALEHNLLQVSDPKHWRYGQHLSAHEVHDLIRPSSETIDALHDWLRENDVDITTISYSTAKDWMKLELPVAKIETLLDTQYCRYRNEDGAEIIRTLSWSVPVSVRKHIATIQPTNSFFGMKNTRRSSSSDSSHTRENPSTRSIRSSIEPRAISSVCNESAVTLDCLRTLYGTVDYKVQAAGKSSMATTNFLGQVDIPTDADMFLEKYRPEAAGAAESVKQVSINGGTISQTLNSSQLKAGVGHEGDLDEQMILGMAWPVPLTVYATGGEPPFIPDLTSRTNDNEPYLTWLDYMLSLPDPLPSVISTSYDDDEQTVPMDYAVSVCNGLAQLGARGVTVLFSSGDAGVGEKGRCYTNDGKNSSTFLATFPSSCPYVTSIGGTYKFEPEVAVFRNKSGNIFASGGGFSSYFQRPAYQDAAVGQYLDNVLGDRYAGLYNRKGRGYPDISAQSLFLPVYYNGSEALASGTSASTPIIGGILALVNDALVAANRPTLGFLNPWLYSEGFQALNDVLTGSNYGCGTPGFPASSGWDAATGFGTPNFKAILNLLGLDITHGKN